MKIKTRIFLYSALILAYFGYKIIRNLELFKPVTPVPGRNCRHIPSPPGGEDIVLFGDTLIFSGDDRIRLWQRPDGAENTPNGRLFALGRHSDSPYEVPLLGWPEAIAFHPHGLFLLGSRLFAVNHAYHKGGERVEAFELASDPAGRVLASYAESFELGGQLNGVFNDLVAVSRDEFYLTRWLVFPHGQRGRGQDLAARFKFILPGLFELRSTHVYFCRRNRCERTSAPPAQMYNGLDWDGEGRLFASSSTDRAVYELRIDPSEPRNLTLGRTFKLRNSPDNVFYDKERNELTVASIGKAIQFLKFERAAKSALGGRVAGFEFYTGYEVVDLDSGVARTALMQKEVIYGVSSAKRVGGKVYLGSFADDRIAVCDE